MADYADDSELKEYADDIFDHGVSSFSSEITRASADVLNRIKSEWWPNAISSKSSETTDSGLLPPVLDEQYLNEAALKQITIYRTFGFHAYPRLAKYSDIDGDSFSRRADFYRGMYDEEWKLIRNLPLYDFNADSSFDDTERRGPMGRRLIRA